MMSSDKLSQYSNLKFNRLSSSDGLSSNAIVNAYEDSKGFMWFSAYDGLNKYDGSKIKVYKNDINNERSISLGYVFPIMEDKDNRLWVGTIGGGLCEYIRETDDFVRYENNPDDPFSISDNSITRILEDEAGMLWISTRKGGLNKFDKRTGKFYSYKNDPEDETSIISNNIWTLFIDKKKTLWIGTQEHGLDMYDKEQGKFIHYKKDCHNSNSLSCNEIKVIYEDHNEILWIGTNRGGLNKWDRTTGKFTHYRFDASNPEGIGSDSIRDITEDQTGMFWLANQKEGINIFDPDNEKFIRYKNDPSDADSISSNNIDKSYRDNSGTLWFCSAYGGVFYYNSNKWKFEHYRHKPNDPQSLSSNGVWSMCEDKRGSIWITTSNGVNVLTGNNKYFRQFFHDPENTNSLSSNEMSWTCCDNEGKIWIGGTDSFLDGYDHNSNGFKHFYKNNSSERFAYITYLYEDKKGFLWVGSHEEGVRVYNKDRTEWKSYKCDSDNPEAISSNIIYSIMEDNEGNMWFGNYTTGLDKLDRKTGKFTNYRNIPGNKNSLSGNFFINPIYQDKKGFIWIGTGGQGLNKFDEKQNKFTHYTELNGLCNNVIWGILEDDHGNLWISTSKGISKFNPETETFHNYDVGDGLQSDEYNQGSYLKASDGRMFFGGINGFNCFYPDSIPENKNVPKIAITEFKIFNKEAKLKKSITETKEITISHKENFFSFDFAALDYTNTSKNNYAYMLQGVDKDWNYVGNTRTANYTNIAPGEYTFVVRGSNNDGVWNNEGASIKIIITPPFYKTVWFQGSTLLSLMGGIGFIVRDKFKKIQIEKRRQQEFTKKLMEFQEDERKRVAAELHDSLGQDLLIIKNKALISIKKTDDVSKFKEQMNEISDLTSSTINEVREISYNLRPYELDRLGLTKTLQSLISRAADSTNIFFDSEIDYIDKLFMPDGEINIYRIVQECLNNIIKHSEATKVYVNIKKIKNEISILISDNGKGFDVQDKFSNSERKGFGLRGMPERVKLFSGIFRIDSAPGKGTKIEMVIPLKNMSMKGFSK